MIPIAHSAMRGSVPTNTFCLVVFVLICKDGSHGASTVHTQIFVCHGFVASIYLLTCDGSVGLSVTFAMYVSFSPKRRGPC